MRSAQKCSKHRTTIDKDKECFCNYSTWTPKSQKSTTSFDCNEKAKKKEYLRFEAYDANRSFLQISLFFIFFFLFCALFRVFVIVVVVVVVGGVGVVGACRINYPFSFRRLRKWSKQKGTIKFTDSHSIRFSYAV